MRVSDNAVPGSKALGEHVEVVTVEMHGMGGREVIIDYEAHGGVGIEVVDLPIGVGVGEIPSIGEGENGGAIDGD